MADAFTQVEQTETQICEILDLFVAIQDDLVKSLEKAEEVG